MILFDHNLGSRSFHSLEELKIFLGMFPMPIFESLTISTRGRTVLTKVTVAALVGEHAK